MPSSTLFHFSPVTTSEAYLNSPIIFEIYMGGFFGKGFEVNVPSKVN